MAKPKLFVVTGKMRSGKDTFKDILTKSGLPLKNFALATKVKEITAKIVGLSETDLEKYKAKYRSNLIYTGQVGRAINPDAWINFMDADFISKNDSIITDVRFKNELDFFKKFSKTNDVYLIRIVADPKIRYSRGADPSFDQNESEIDLDDILDESFNGVLLNNGTMTNFEAVVDEWLVEMNLK